MSKQSTTNTFPSRMMPRTLAQDSARTTAEGDRLSERARHRPYKAANVLAFLFGFCLTQCPPVAFAHENERPPSEYSAAACYGLVQDAGRGIAWARWEKGLPLEKTRSTPFRADTPAWVIDLVRGWIADAYQWRATDEQVRQWAAELGSVNNMPSAEALSVHETIAVWLRRIARLCNERDVHARASTNLIDSEVSLEQ